MPSSQKKSKVENSTAEQLFRHAFTRLKENRPEHLPKGSPVSQNNVAKEAGRDPSALRKSRYPTLINDIQRWLRDPTHETSPSKRKIDLAKRSQNRDFKKRLEEIKLQRDQAVSRLVEADAKILELALENADLIAKIEILEGPSTPSNVTNFRGRNANKK
ncbi:hypothetical protein [Paraburkholderia fungorum]|uniref:hypothetical protein n=1 Tax=Paraburkholderia fungorum TaxID=134537 RepID=UPI001C0C55BB|nr:hypothetical protein [Paraburkholderia fungorum]